MRKNFTLRKIRTLLSVVLGFTFLMAFPAVSDAQVRVPFTQRTSQYTPAQTIYNIKGDFTMIGNTNLTLQNYADNLGNENNMVYVDVDGVSNTFNSSSATLGFSTENGAIPECSNIIYAGLYWTGRAHDGTSPNTFEVTKDVPGTIPQAINNDLVISTTNSIQYTNYQLTVIRSGVSNNRTLTYRFSPQNALGDIVEFIYAHNNGNQTLQVSINGGPVTSVSTSSIDADNAYLSTPYVIYSESGGITLTVNRLYRDGRNSTAQSARAFVNVSGTYFPLVSLTKPLDKSVVYLKHESASGYTQINATDVNFTRNIYYPTNTDGYMYSAYAEVTDYVRQNGIGEYFVADIALREGNGGGTGFFGGWGLIVVYENSLMKYRNITIFDGHAYVVGSTTTSQEIPVSGFQTVPDGDVIMKLGLMAGEGDRGISGDYFQIRNYSDNQWINLTHGGNTTNNFFNSSIFIENTERNPNLVNNTGLDISMFEIPNANNSIITNDQTSTTFRYGTTQDTYIIFCMAMAVEAYTPEPLASNEVITVNDQPYIPGNPVLPGDEIEYTLEVLNYGTEAINDFLITIPIPYTIDFVSSSAVFFYTEGFNGEQPYFDPLEGATGSIIWNIGYLPLPDEPEDVLAVLTYRFRVTEDCFILSNPQCDPAVTVDGGFSGFGDINNNTFSGSGFIQGFETDGVCAGQPIYDPVSILIDREEYIAENCNDQDYSTRVFTYCNVTGTTIPFTDVNGFFPIGSRFYNEYPVGSGTIEYTNATGFPATTGNLTYYAIPPGITDCYWPFTIVITTISSTPSVSDVFYCEGDLAEPLTATPSSPEYPLLFYYTTLSSELPTYSITPLTTPPGTTSYYVAEGISAQCISPSRATINVTVYENPECLITGPASPVCPGAALQFSATEGMDEYAWIVTGNASISGSNTQQTVNILVGDDCELPFTIELTVTNGNDCDSSCQLEVLVEDVSAPVFTTIPADLTVECDGSGNTTQLNNWLANVAASDGCGNVSITHDFTALSNDCGATGSALVTWTAEDDCGNTTATSASFTIVDTTAPVIDDTLLADLTLECDGTTDPSGAIAAWLAANGGATADDDCSTVTWSHNYTGLSDGCGATGNATVTFTATDACGLSSSVSANITIVDTTAPTITTQASSLSVECDGAGNTDALNAWLASNGGANATDECGTVSWSNNFTSLSDLCGATGTASVTFTATDACGNTSTTTASFTIVDTTAPVIDDTLLADLTLECDGTTDPSGAIAAWLAANGGATADDDCSTVTWSHNYTGLSDGCGATGTATVTFTATDACGLSSSVSANITIVDTNAPTITTQASSLSVECDGAGNTDALNAWLASNGGANATDECGTVSWSNNFTSLSDLCGATGTASVTFTATDACGNTSTTTASFTIVDTTAPVIDDTLLADLTLECDGTTDPSGAIAAWLAANGGATADDDCSTVTWSHNYTGLSDGCGATGNATVTFTATDACGLSSSVSANITIVDTTAPTITTQASSLSVECDGAGNTDALNAWLASNGGANATDDCGTVSWSNNFTSLSDLCGATGTASVTFTATDACGNTSTTTASFTIVDTTAPVIDDTLLADLTLECDGTTDPSGAIAAWLAANGGATADDDCSTVTWSHNYTGLSDGCGATGTATVTFTATDACGLSSSVSANITIVDTTAPTITTQASSLSVECDGAGNTDALNAWLASNGGANATDDCGTVSWSNNFTSLSDLCGATGTASVTFTATDACGNTSTTTASFTIVDTTPPLFTCPTNITVTADAEQDFASVTIQVPLVSEACGTISLVNDFTSTENASGQYPLGTTTVTYTATDECGLSYSCSFTVTVQDDEAPVITCPPTITVNCISEVPAPYANYAAFVSDGGLATDNNEIDESSFVMLSETTNGFNCPETITRTYQIADDDGNISSCSQLINVDDQLNPIFTIIPENLTVECDGLGNTVELNNWLTNVAATDNCGSVSITNNFTTLSDDCGATGSALVTWTAEDDCGNTTATSATFTIVDTTAPVIDDTLLADLTLECDGTTDPSGAIAAWLAANGGATADDDCSTVTWSHNYTGLSDGCGATGTATVTFTATDACGLSSSVSANITIVDTTAPTITTQASSLSVECDGAGNTDALNAWLASNGGANATDDCGTVSWSNNFTSLSDLCGATGTASVTFTATDACGNTSTTTASFTIVDTTAPVIDDTLLADLTLECDGTTDPSGAIAAWLAANGGATADDDCSTVTWSHNYTGLSDGCGATGTATVTFTATDACGLSSSVSANITIVDTTAPTITTQASSLSVECDGAGNTDALNAWLASNGGANATDDCGTVSWSNNFTSLSDLCGATGTASVTFTATDACGNTSTTTASFTIVDTTAPVIDDTLLADLTLECDGTTDPSGAIAAWLAANGGATADDDCSTVTWSHNYTGLSDGCGATGTATVTFTATDACGLSSSVSANITIVDTTAPTITTQASSLSVECDGAGNTDALNAWLASNGGANATDDCGTVSWSNNFTSLSDLCGATGTASVTFTATDACGNTSTTTASFTIVDTTAPVIDDTLLADLTLECDGTTDPSGAIAAWLAANGGATADDDCSTVTWSHNYTGLSDGCGATGTATVTFTATDACGLSSSVSANITIVDTNAPTITTQASSLSVECDGAGNTDALNAWLASNGGANATDDCGTVSWSNNFTSLSDLCGATGTASVTFTATDACGNTSTTTASFTIVDTTAPVIDDTLLADLTLECDGTTDPSGAIAAWLAANGGATADDDCSTVTWSHNYTGLSDGCGATGTATVTFTATDACGLSSSVSANITIVDTNAPTITTQASSLSVECDGAGNTDALNAWLASNGGANATDDCGTVSWSNNFTSLSDLCGATGTASVTFTATDACGNTSTTTASFTIVDTTAPVIDDTLLADLTLECDGTTDPSGAIAAWLAANGGATADDDCSTVTWSHNYTGLSDGCGATGTATVTFTATDACGLSSSVSANITIVDTNAPTITTQASSLSVECDGAGNTDALNAWLASNGGANATDDCGTVSWSNNFTSLSDLCGATGTASVTFTATDACGNTSTTTASFTIVDTTPPVITCPENLILTADQGQDYATVLVPLPEIFESCGSVTLVNDFTLTDDASGQYPLGPTIVTYTVTDECGMATTCSFTVTVNDNEPPIISCPPEVTVECISQVPEPFDNYEAFVLAGGFATDNSAIDEDSFILISQTTDGLTCPQTIFRTYQIGDDEGNISQCTHLIIIHDQTPPVFSYVPPDLIVECDGEGNWEEFSAWLASITLSDNCGTVFLTNDFTGFTDECGGTGLTLVTWTAVDLCGNEATASASFGIADLVPPVFTQIPQNLTVECDGLGNTSKLSNWLAGVAATDACGDVTITNDFTALSDECGATGSAMVTWTATDDCGNTTTTTATFTIVDTTAPVFTTIPEDLTVECDGEGNTNELNAWLAEVTAEDDCGGVTITNDFTALSDECGATGSATVTWTATDDCGNTTTTTATFTIVDTTAPVFTTIPEDLTVECDGEGNTNELNAWLAEVTAEDDCGGVTITNDFTALSDECGATGSATVTWTATDDCGNTTTTTATFTIVDTTAPVFTTIPEDLTVECDGEGNTNELNAWLAEVTAEDGCGGVTITNDFTALSDECGATGSATVTWTATDDCGNTTTTTATFTIVDTTAPIISCPNSPIVVIISAGETGYVASNGEFDHLGISDICGEVTATHNLDHSSENTLDGYVFPLGDTEVIWTVTDDCGNIAECSFIVTIYAPSLLVTKTADPQTYSNVGEEISYTITLTNNGNATLTDVVVTDPLTGLDFTIETLLPGETATFYETYIITYEDLYNGSVENIAFAAGFDPEGNEVAQSDSEIIYVVLDELQITLVSQTNVLCFGDETGAAEVQVTGGLYPYTIIWYTDPEQTGTEATNLPAGTYVVIVTDALGNTAQLTVTITQPDAPLNITYQLTNVLCNGAATGAVDVEIFGGTQPYTFQWSNGATTASINDLLAGSYSLLIEDANGCILELEVEITQPDALNISNINIVGVLCMEDQEGSIMFTVNGGVPPYTYFWSNEATSAGLVNVAGGDYSVEITDANGCVLSYDFFIPYQEEDCELRFPQGVTPNADGFNDYWVINGLIRFPNNKLRIFNRWGTIVYEAYPYKNDWDGRPNRGRPADGPDGILPSGTYFYVIELEPGMDPISGYIYLVK